MSDDEEQPTLRLVGAPTKYKPEFAAQALDLCKRGATDYELSLFFDVHRATIYRWAQRHPEFSDALKLGTEAPDERVKRSLFERATGYTYPSVKVFQFQGQPVVVDVVEHVPPDTTAAIFWLKNRRPDLWRDVNHRVNSGTVQVVDALDAEIARLSTELAGTAHPDVLVPTDS